MGRAKDWCDKSKVNFSRFFPFSNPSHNLRLHTETTAQQFVRRVRGRGVNFEINSKTIYRIIHHFWVEDIFFKYFFLLLFCTTNFGGETFFQSIILIFNCIPFFIPLFIMYSDINFLVFYNLANDMNILSFWCVHFLVIDIYKTGWFLGQISIKYLRIWMGSEMLVAEGWLWLKSIIKTGAKQMAKFWGFILLREDWAVTFDKWSITWTRQFWNEWEECITIACKLLQRPKT